jgi:hypothetical protein
MTRDDYTDMLLSAKDADDEIDELDVWARDEGMGELDQELLNRISVAQTAVGDLIAYLTMRARD